MPPADITPTKAARLIAVDLDRAEVAVARSEARAARDALSMVVARIRETAFDPPGVDWPETRAAHRALGVLTAADLFPSSDAVDPPPLGMRVVTLQPPTTIADALSALRRRVDTLVDTRAEVDGFEAMFGGDAL